MNEEKQRLIKMIDHLGYILAEYVNSHLEKKGRPRPCIVWPDGSDLGMGFASHLSGDPGFFIKLGFKGYDDFYSLYMKSRNAFLKEGLVIFNKIFPKNFKRLSHKEALKRYVMFLKELKELARKFRRKKFRRKVK